MNEKKKIGEPSPQAIDFAERMIALKWTRETNVDTIAGTWQAGYVAAQLDLASPTPASDGVEFAEWVVNTGFSPTEGEEILWVENKKQYKKGEPPPYTPMTTAELYTLFTQTQSKDR